MSPTSFEVIPSNHGALNLIEDSVAHIPHAPTLTGVFPVDRQDTQHSIAHSGPLGQIPNEFFPVKSLVTTPVKVDVLESLLTGHPNKTLVRFIVSGFRYGFKLGFQDNELKSCINNNKSSIEYETKVDEAILKELNRGHTVGPFASPPFKLHCSPLGAAPKKDGTVRVVLDLSSPHGHSVNDGITKEDYSVSYSSFDDAVEMVKRLGRNCYMAKLDIKHAFRLCPVHPSDWHLLGYKWKGRYLFDVVLPFGGRSSPFIFNNFANILEWMLLWIYFVKNLLHYLDDFITAALSKNICQAIVKLIKDVFDLLGVPLAPDKMVGPCQVITYLGIEIDTVNFVVRLPQDKFTELLSSLHNWLGKKKCTKRELLSLIGSLSFACKVVKCGRMFLRRLIDLSTTVRSLHHHISLTTESRKDIQWWCEFLPTWNGIAIIHTETLDSSSINLFTDASGVGIGGFFSGAWFSIALNLTHKYSITFIELLAIVVAVFSWGEAWKNKQLVLYTDNLAIVHVWSSGSCRCPNIMHLVRFLFFYTAEHNINLLVRHIKGQHNTYADLLSRLQVQHFKHLCPEAEADPTPIPSSILQLFKEI